MILLLILVIGWNAFSTYSFLAHKKQHKERLQGLVLQAKEAHQSISQGEILSPNEMFSKLSQPSIFLIEELESWDAYMSGWQETGRIISLIFIAVFSVFLCTQMIPKDGNQNDGNSKDNRVYVSRNVLVLLALLINIGSQLWPSQSRDWKYDLGEIKRTWSFEYVFKEIDYGAWVNFFTNIWPESFIDSFESRFDLPFSASIAVTQFFIFILLMAPFFIQLETAPIEVPEDKLQPGERVLKFPEESERKPMDRWT